jgi:hypothetical protein
VSVLHVSSLAPHYVHAVRHNMKQNAFTKPSGIYGIIEAKALGLKPEGRGFEGG